MTSPRFSKKAFRLSFPVMALFASTLALVLSACTGQPNASLLIQNSASQKLSTSASESCLISETSFFEKLNQAEQVDLDQETLPSGLYLATMSEVLIEKKNEDPSQSSRIYIRETPGAKNPKIVCEENIDKIGQGFELALTGLVKFDTTQRAEGSNFTARQFLFFSESEGHGLIIRNPKLVRHAPSLRAFLRSSGTNGEIFRLNEQSYVLRFHREREGVKAQLLIRLDLV